MFPGFFDVVANPLDAGAAITVTGPNGSKQLTPGGLFYQARLGDGSGATVQPLYLDPGAYNVSAPGGHDVGKFSQSLTVPPLAWTNKDAITTGDRSAGLLVTWTGGDPQGTVQITGAVPGNGFVCNAKTSDRQFTVPAFVMLNLPASSDGGLVLSTTSITPFSAPGIGSGAIYATVTIERNVMYK